MAHAQPDFETKDVLGKTLQYVASVGLAPIALPSVAGAKISEVLIRNPKQNMITTDLFYSFDGGVTFLTLGRGEFVGWTLKNNASDMPITQIFIKGSNATTYYEVIINSEPS